MKTENHFSFLGFFDATNNYLWVKTKANEPKKDFKKLNNSYLTKFGRKNVNYISLWPLKFLTNYLTTH
jgi:hypothetical protein